MSDHVDQFIRFSEPDPRSALVQSNTTSTITIPGLLYFELGEKFEIFKVDTILDWTGKLIIIGGSESFIQNVKITGITSVNQLICSGDLTWVECSIIGGASPDMESYNFGLKRGAYVKAGVVVYMTEQWRDDRYWTHKSRSTIYYSRLSSPTVSGTFAWTRSSILFTGCVFERISHDFDDCGGDSTFYQCVHNNKGIGSTSILIKNQTVTVRSCAYI